MYVCLNSADLIIPHHYPLEMARIRQWATFSSKPHRFWFLIYTCWAKLIFECFQTLNSGFLNFEKNQKQNVGATSKFFFVFDFFKFKKFSFSRLNTFKKCPKSKEYRLKSNPMRFGGKKLLAGGFSYHFPAGGEFSMAPYLVYLLNCLACPSDASSYSVLFF